MEERALKVLIEIAEDSHVTEETRIKACELILKNSTNSSYIDAKAIKTIIERKDNIVNITNYYV